MGNAVFVCSRPVGNIKGLKLLGIKASKHPRWANPYFSVEYQDDLAGELGPAYDELRREHGGELPYVMNPFSLWPG